MSAEIRQRKKYEHSKAVRCFSEVSEETRTHYLHYIFDPSLPWLDRMYWLIFCTISLTISLILIVKMWNKWGQANIEVSFADKPTPIWQVPFPAITICSEIKSRQRAYNFTENYHKVLEHLLYSENGILTDEELQTFSDTSLVCDNHLYRQGPNFTTFETIDRLQEITQPFDEMFWSCKWTNLNESCASLFTPTLTEDGICFTFNMLGRKQVFTDQISLPGGYMDQEQESEGWSLDEGYPSHAGKDTYPRRAISAGSQAGLYLLLRAYEQDLDYVCRGPVQGFKVLLHHPAETPRVASQYFRAVLNQEMVFSIKPSLTVTSPDLKKYAPGQRHCFFSDERPLQFFQIYTQQNCQSECIANYTLRKCGCVSYHMPRNKTTKICGSGNTQCVFDAHQELLAQEVNAAIDFYKSDDFENLPTDCGCLPSCTSITYDAEISQADFRWEKVFEAFKANTSEFPGLQVARLTLFFKDFQFTSIQRKSVHSSLDFLASCGGILGLLSGLSFLTIVEIIYFSTLRLMRKRRSFNLRSSTGSEDLVDIRLDN